MAVAEKQSTQLRLSTCVEGISREAFDALFESGGVLYQAGRSTPAKSRKHTLECLKNEYAGKKSQGRPITHTWRFSEDGGFYRVYDVKKV